MPKKSEQKPMGGAHKEKDEIRDLHKHIDKTRKDQDALPTVSFGRATDAKGINNT
jgi:hypothetical protein